MRARPAPRLLSAPAARRALSHPRLRLGLRLALTLAILAFLWRAVDGPAVVAAILAASPLWLGAAVAVLVLQTALSAQRWRVTAAQLGQSLHPARALREYFLSQALNQALPGAVMGDAARAVRARQGNGLRIAMQAVIFERLAGQIAMFLTLVLAFVATDTARGGLDWPPAWRATLWTVTLAGAAILALVVFLTMRPAPASERLQGWIAAMGDALFARRVLARQILLGALITACNLAAFACAGRAIGMVLTPVEIAALVPVILFAMLIPFTVSGWGIREGAAAIVLPIAGVASTDAVAASVMFGAALFMAVLPGAFLMSTR